MLCDMDGSPLQPTYLDGRTEEPLYTLPEALALILAELPKLMLKAEVLVELTKALESKFGGM